MVLDWIGDTNSKSWFLISRHLFICYSGLNVCICPQIHCWNSHPYMMISGGGALGLGRWLGHHDAALMNENSTLIRKPESQLPLSSPREDTVRRQMSVNQEEFSPKLNPNLGFPASELWEINARCLSHTGWDGNVLEQPKLTKLLTQIVTDVERNLNIYIWISTCAYNFLDMATHKAQKSF